MRLFSLYILAVLLLTSSVEAREEFWYAGAGAGGTYLEDRNNAFDSIDNKSVMGKAYVGYRASTYLAFEAEYADLGEYDYSRALIKDKAKYQVVSLLIAVMYPLIWDDFELFTPVGVSIIDSNHGINDETIAGGRLGFGVAYTPSKHFTIRVGADLTAMKQSATINNETNDYTLNLVATYMTLQYNF